MHNPSDLSCLPHVVLFALHISTGLTTGHTNCGRTSWRGGLNKDHSINMMQLLAWIKEKKINGWLQFVDHCYQLWSIYSVLCKPIFYCFFNLQYQNFTSYWHEEYLLRQTGAGSPVVEVVATQPTHSLNHKHSVLALAQSEPVVVSYLYRVIST